MIKIWYNIISIIIWKTLNKTIALHHKIKVSEVLRPIENSLEYQSCKLNGLFWKKVNMEFIVYLYFDNNSSLNFFNTACMKTLSAYMCMFGEIRERNYSGS